MEIWGKEFFARRGPTHAKVFLRKTSLRTLSHCDLVQNGELWYMRTQRGGQKKDEGVEESLVLLLLTPCCAFI